jgi:hypothetical protein
MLKVKYTFKARNPDELDCVEGEELVLLNKINRDWILAQNEKGAVGIVPCSYTSPLLPINMSFNNTAFKDYYAEVGKESISFVSLKKRELVGVIRKSDIVAIIQRQKDQLEMRVQIRNSDALLMTFKDSPEYVLALEAAGYAIESVKEAITFEAPADMLSPPALREDVSLADKPSVIKQSYLKKKSSKFTGEWNKKYCVLTSDSMLVYMSIEKYEQNTPSHTIPIMICTAKLSGAKFEVITPNKNYLFLAETDDEASQWVSLIHKCVQQLLETNHDSASEGSVEMPNSETVKKILKNSSTCADCNDANPDWVSINLGCLICIKCSGVHRSLGVHLSKVRSLSLDTLEYDTLCVLNMLGNEVVNSIYEKSLQSKPIDKDSPRDEREAFIREKYVQKKFTSQDPLIISQFSFLLDGLNVSVEDLSSDAIVQSFVLFYLCYKLSVEHAVLVDSPNVLVDGETESNDKARSIIICFIDLWLRGAELNFVYDENVDMAYHEEAASMVNGRTLLHYVAESGRFDLLVYLVSIGADAYVKDSNGDTVADLALRNGYENIHSYLKKNKMHESTSSLGSFESAMSDQNVKTLHGWIVKSGGQDGSKGWNKRYFVYDEGVKDVKYFKTRSLRELCGSVNLTEVLDVQECLVPADFEAAFKDWKFAIQVHTWDRIYSFVLRTQDEMQAWMAVFRKYMQKRAKSNTVIPVVTGKVFGIDLSRLAERRQGSRDRGIPLFISKCVGFFHQLVSKVEMKESMLSGVYSGNITGVSQAGILSLVKHLKNSFDESDESVNLADEYSAWCSLEEFKSLDEEKLALAYMRALTLLMMSYFSSLPNALVSHSDFSKLGEITSNLRSLHSEYSSGLSQHHDDVPSHLLNTLVVPTLKQMPETNYQTLKKVAQHLFKLYQQTQSNKLARIMANAWAGPIFGLGNLQVFEKQVRAHEDRVFFVELVVKRFDVLFHDKKDDEKQKLVPEASVSLDSESFFPVDVYIVGADVEHSLFSKRIAMNMTASDLCAMISENYQKSGAFEGFALHELVNDCMIRKLEDDENVFQIVTNWTTPVGHKLIFKKCAASLLCPTITVNGVEQKSSASQPLMCGWIYKEGIAIKSWRKRYFVLKDDFLFYYKDQKCTIQSLVGKLAYKNMGIYVVKSDDSIERKRPTTYCICIRSKCESEVTSPRYLCFENMKDLDMWVSALTRASIKRIESPVTATAPSLSNVTPISPQNGQKNGMLAPPTDLPPIITYPEQNARHIRFPSLPKTPTS